MRNPTARPRPSFRPEVETLESRTAPAILTPVQMRNAYGFDDVQFTVNGKTIVGDGSGQTIAIVNAYHNANIFSDLDGFNLSFSINGTQTLYEQYGPASSFLKQVNPHGKNVKDPTGGLWLLETALDVQWAHVMAPGADILLVQAKSNSYVDLFNAVNYARKQPGVVAVSLSWGSPEFVGETYYDKQFTSVAGHKGGSNGLGGPKLAGGVTFVAASGDNGAPGLWPAMSPNVVAVGGTTLTTDVYGNYKGEVGWSGSGGGVSAYEIKPAYQATVTFSTNRTNPDVAFNGDPASGVYVYSTSPLNGTIGGWWQVGGTSAGTPQWAALIAVANQGRALQGLGSLDGPTQTLPALYSMPASAFRDVTKGNNGFAAGPGYDLVTGRGSPLAVQVVNHLLQAAKQPAPTLVKTTVKPKAAAMPIILPQLDVTTVPAGAALAHVGLYASTVGSAAVPRAAGGVVLVVAPVSARALVELEADAQTSAGPSPSSFVVHPRAWQRPEAMAQPRQGAGRNVAPLVSVSAAVALEPAVDAAEEDEAVLPSESDQAAEPEEAHLQQPWLERDACFAADPWLSPVASARLMTVPADEEGLHGLALAMLLVGGLAVVRSEPVPQEKRTWPIR